MTRIPRETSTTRFRLHFHLKDMRFCVSFQSWKSKSTIINRNLFSGSDSFGKRTHTAVCCHGTALSWNCRYRLSGPCRWRHRNERKALQKTTTQSLLCSTEDHLRRSAEPLCRLQQQRDKLTRRKWCRTEVPARTASGWLNRQAAPYLQLQIRSTDRQSVRESTVTRKSIRNENTNSSRPRTC